MGRVILPKLNKLFTRKQINEIRRNLIEENGDRCAICKTPRDPAKNALSVDHNHRTSRIRGLLCYRCNKFLVGRHSLESAKSVYEYLLKYDPEGG